LTAGGNRRSSKILKSRIPPSEKYKAVASPDEKRVIRS
jgi:hypothetical protein